MFLEITGRDGFDIHIRTKGTFDLTSISEPKGHSTGMWQQSTGTEPSVSRNTKAAVLPTLPDAIKL